MTNTGDDQLAAADEIFVSYASVDRDIVAPVVGLLKEIGWSVFWDTNIEPGETWRKVIGTKLSTARCVLVFWSPTSIDRQWVIQEAEDGERRGCLVPVTVRGAIPPLGLRHIQAMDLTSWSGEPQDPTIRKLLLAVARHTRTPTGLARWHSAEQAAQDGNTRADEKPTAEPNDDVAAGRAVNLSPDTLEILRWQQVKLGRNIAEIEQYCAEYPGGRFADAATELGKELWTAVVASGNATRLQEFIEHYPTVSYAKRARLLLLWHQARSSSNLEDVESFLSAAYAIDGTLLDLSTLNPFVDQSVGRRKASDLKGIDDIGDPAVIGWINGVLRVTLFAKEADQGVNVTGGNADAIRAYLDKYPNGFLRPKVLAVNDWLNAIAAGTEQAVERFFARHPVDSNTERILYQAVENRRDKEILKRAEEEAKENARKEREQAAKEAAERRAKDAYESRIEARRKREFRTWIFAVGVLCLGLCVYLVHREWDDPLTWGRSIWEHLSKAAVVAAIPSLMLVVFYGVVAGLRRVFRQGDIKAERSWYVRTAIYIYFLIFCGVFEYFMFYYSQRTDLSIMSTGLLAIGMLTIGIITAGVGLAFIDWISGTVRGGRRKRGGSGRWVGDEEGSLARDVLRNGHRGRQAAHCTQNRAPV